MNSQNAIAFAFDERAVRLFPTNAGSFIVVAKDVADALGYQWSGIRTIGHVPEEWRGVESVSTLQGSQELHILTEEGLYFFLARSDKPKARAFQKWLAGEVLPSIRKNGHYGRGPSITQQLAAGREIRRLLQELKRETNPAVRRTLYAQLEHHCRLIAISVPALEEIGHDALPDHESPQLEEFWEVVDTLEQAGHALNHARDKALLALNLPQVRAAAAAARLALPETGDLRRLLRACRSPRFVAVKAVNSARDTTTVKCWVFERPNEAFDGAYGLFAAA